MRTTLIAGLLAALMVTGVRADTLVDFDFDGNAGNEASVAPGTTDASVSMAANLTRSNLNGGTSGTWEADGFGVRPTSTYSNDLASAVSNGRYITFSITVESGYSVDLSAIDFGWARQNGKLRSFTVMASLDGGTTGFTTGDAIDTETVIDSSNNGTSHTLDLSGDSRLQDIAEGTTVEIRLYYYGDLNQWEGNGITSKNSLPSLDLIGTAEISLSDQPVCTIDSPTDGTLYAYGSYPSPLPITATATDNVGVVTVRFYENWNLIGTDSSYPYALDWNWSPLQGTNYYLTATAEDGSGNIGTSQTVRVETGRDQDPTISITNPVDGTYYEQGSYPATILIGVDAEDDSGIDEVRFYSNGGQIGTDSTAPYELDWNWLAAKGIYTLTAVAEDDASNTTESVAAVIEALGPMPAGLLAYDDFARTAAGALHDVGSGVGWDGRWDVQGNNTVVPGYNVTTSTPLVYASLSTTTNYVTGGVAFLGCKRELDMSGSGPFASYLHNGDVGAPGTDVWATWLYRRDATAGASCQLSFGRDAGGNGATTLRKCRVLNSGDEWVVQHITNDVVVTSVSSGIACVEDETALLAVHFEFGSDSNHVVSLYVNPPADTLGASPPVAADAVLNVTDDGLFQFDGIDFYPGSSPGLGSFDEFRVGTSYAAVTPITFPSGSLVIVR